MDYASFSTPRKRVEGERLAAEIKDVKGAIKLFRQLERMYNSTSCSDNMDAKIDIYRYAVFNLTDYSFHVYMPLGDMDFFIDWPMPVFQKIGEVISKREYHELVSQYPEIEGKFEYFNEDTPPEDIVLSKSDEILKSKIIKIKEFRDADMPLEEKASAIKKVIKSSKGLRELFDYSDFTVEEILNFD